MRNIKWAYISYILLIVFISFLLYLFLNSTHDMQFLDAQRINLAGKQRMLSQRLVKEALHITEFTQVREVQKSCSDLEQTIRNYKEQEEALANGPLYWKVEKESRLMVDSLHERYLGLRNRYLATAQKVTAYCHGGMTADEARSLALEMLSDSDAMLSYLEQVVKDMVDEKCLFLRATYTVVDGNRKRKVSLFPKHIYKPLEANLDLYVYPLKAKYLGRYHI